MNTNDLNTALYEKMAAEQEPAGICFCNARLSPTQSTVYSK